MQAASETSSSRAGDGLVDPAFRGALADAVVLYRHMITLRLVSARMVGLQRSEKVAFHSACLGEEGVIAAAALAARAGDWVFPGVREWGAAIVRGLPLDDYMHHAFGSAGDPAKGHSAPDHAPARRFRVGPASGLAGAHVPQAVGAAWAAKIKKDDVATIAIFGEAATGSGDLHNALNFAGVFKPACVFVCRADHARRASDERAAARERAVAYGIASATVDGSDALAVLTVVRAALARSLEGKGATLIEAFTRPLAPTLPAEAWQRGDAALLALGEGDPLVRLRRVLEHERLLDAESDEAITREVRAAIDAAVAVAERAGPPEAATIFEDVYAEVPPHLRAQKESSPWRR
jgi:TPP-dependent pyruvate/acetoin dehydrogenase alpha subunit